MPTSARSSEAMERFRSHLLRRPESEHAIVVSPAAPAKRPGMAHSMRETATSSSLLKAAKRRRVWNEMAAPAIPATPNKSLMKR